jgi:DNA-binding transcriptional MocR family regulator
MPAAIEKDLYVSVADRVGGLIDRGTLRPGQRVPSVRKLSAQLRVSVSTVLAAYRLLEARGRIEARPQSGYYVRPPLAPPPKEPSIPPAPPRASTRVSINDLVERMLSTTAADSGYVQLGGAIPTDQTLPTRQLNRLGSALARRSRRGMNTYDMPPGCPELRAQIARRYLEAGCALAPDDIVTTCGCQEALALCLRAVTRPGDIVAIESPTYYGHLQLIEALGLRALEIPSSHSEGVGIEALADALERIDVRAAMVVTNVHNPLGTVMSDARKKQLVKLLARHDVPLIEDDIYGDLAFARTRPSVCKCDDTAGSILLCSSFSKTLAPGARVGWCAPGRYLGEVRKLKFSTTLATPTLPQMAIAQFLATGGYEHHLRKIRAFYAEQVQLVSAAVQRWFPPGTCVTRPAGGFVVWVALPDGFDAVSLHERALTRKISVAPGVIFSAKGKFRNCLRLNCSAAWSVELDRALRTLGELCFEQGSAPTAGADRGGG